MMDEKLVEELARIARVSFEKGKQELEGLVESCRREMELAGIYGDENDPTYRQAIRLYCKGNYGYDDNAERFIAAYEALRDTMALSGEYRKEAQHGSDTDMDGNFEG